MIQDRLTAKFKTSKAAVSKVMVRPAKQQKSAKKPAADAYTRGRQIAASFWL